VHASGQPQAKGKQKRVQLPLRVLTRAEAKAAVAEWVDDDYSRTDLKLFGRGASKSWTLAVISDLKDMAQELSDRKLRWLLGTAMPLRDDFALYLGNKKIDSSKVKGKKVGTWQLGNKLKKLPKPAPSELEPTVDAKVAAPAYQHWQLIDKLLGPITGYLEVFVNPIDTGSSRYIGRSHGFFVYVNGRLINPDDAGFGIDRNTLRHGTFSRFRLVIHLDRLDEELRSSRESLRDGPQLIRAREILQGAFNFARSKLEAHDAETRTGRQASQRLADSPASLSEKPILRLILAAYEGGETVARHVRVADSQRFADVKALQAHVDARLADGGSVVADVEYADLGVHEPIAVLEGVSGLLQINLEHPFVAHFADEFGNEKRNLPLQLFAISEILLEAHLAGTGIDRQDVFTVLDGRDELLRHLARSRGPRNSLTVAQDLINSASSDKELEAAVVAAFDQLGYEAVPKGGRDESDGIAEAFLPAKDAEVQRYRVSLEAKSKERAGAKVKKKDVEVSTIARHRDEKDCDHAIVVGPRFETGKDDCGALVREIKTDRENTGRTITLIEIDDLARLVRQAPLKRMSLVELRDLFKTAATPTDSRKWIDERFAVARQPPKYRDILETVWSEQEADEGHTVAYSALRTALRLTRQVIVTDEDLKNDCLALDRMATDLFVARDDSVELNTKPAKVLAAISDYIDEEQQSEA
jgi:hypothetical protein